MSSFPDLPECGQPADEAGSPCIRWPGHAGECASAADVLSGKKFSFDAIMDFGPGPSAPDIPDLFDGLESYARRAIFACIVLCVLVTVSLGLSIYSLVR